MKGKDIVKITLNLVVIYLVGGVILAFVYAKTSPIIYRNAVIEKEKALKLLMPEADRIDKLGDWTIHDKSAEYFVAKKGDSVAGYIIQSFGKGYSGYIDTLIAVNPDFTIREISILSHAETPGLGDEIAEKSFLDQFAGKKTDQLSVLKTGNTQHIQAISGATISSRAVAEDAVTSALQYLTNAIQDKSAE